LLLCERFFLAKELEVIFHVIHKAVSLVHQGKQLGIPYWIC